MHHIETPEHFVTSHKIICESSPKVIIKIYDSLAVGPLTLSAGRLTPILKQLVLLYGPLHSAQIHVRQ